jgi:cathepsin A (carboxypeptidase C)
MEMGKAISILVLIAVLQYVRAFPDSDAISSLPDYGPPPTRQWSGFLNGKGTQVAPGCASTEAECQLHYWFAEADHEPAKKPVVLWLNGGPGSSSILGMLQEQGPLIINSTGGLMRNPYAWTTLVNLLILESPTGVGYSYCSTQKAGGVCNNTDKLTAATARAAVVDFFETKFPELKTAPFYITGESYAGVYVPTLAKELLDNAKGSLNFKGLAVGDPCTDNTAQKDSMDMLWYAHKNGFVPDQDFDLLWNKCKARYPSFIGQGRWQRQGSTMTKPKPSLNLQDPACVVAQRKFLASTSNGISQSWGDAWINDLTLYGPSALVSFDTPGSLNYLTAAYMTRADVQVALHVDLAPSKTWPNVQQGFSYVSQYDACNGNVMPGTPSMIDFYREIAPQLEQTIVFNGDTDPCVSYEGTRTAISRVGYVELDGGSYRPWFFEHSAATVEFLKQKPLLFGPDLALVDAGVQFGGHIVNYDKNLSFVTVHGSGHMVPQFRPQAALHLLRKLVSGEPFSPRYMSNASIASATDDQYSAELSRWTEAAKSAPYSSFP